jgi:virginiamycin B lyase
LWFTEYESNKIGRIATSGAFTEYSIPTRVAPMSSSYPIGIVAGPDGALWFTEDSGNRIGRITTSGAFAEYPIPASLSYPNSIAAGSDRGLWFTETAAGKIGKVTTSGAFTEYSIPTAKARQTHAPCLRHSTTGPSFREPSRHNKQRGLPQSAPPEIAV